MEGYENEKMMILNFLEIHFFGWKRNFNLGIKKLKLLFTFFLKKYIINI